jgi:amino acid permease
MRFFALLNFQHIMLYLFPTLTFILLFGIGLAYSHFNTKDVKEQTDKIIHTYPEDIEERNAPFPLILILIIVGTLLWAFFYTLGHGIWRIKI